MANPWRGCGSCWANLSVSAVLLLALPTGEEVGLGPSCPSYLVLPDRFLCHGFPDLLQLVTGHFLSRKKQRQVSPASPPHCCQSHPSRVTDGEHRQQGWMAHGTMEPLSSSLQFKSSLRRQWEVTGMLSLASSRQISASQSPPLTGLIVWDSQLRGHVQTCPLNCRGACRSQQ